MIVKNESFQCIGCKKQVPPASKTCRNHCPYCFISLHVDGDIPGDRKTNCHGLMYAFEYQLKHSEYRIHFQCKSCGKQHRNRVAQDDDFAGLESAIRKGNEALIGS